MPRSISPARPTPLMTASASRWCGARSASLNSTDRKILLLTLVEGLKPGEIGARLALTSEIGAGPEVARPEKNHRPCEKTVTKMSANATKLYEGQHGLRPGWHARRFSRATWWAG